MSSGASTTSLVRSITHTLVVVGADGASPATAQEHLRQLGKIMQFKIKTS